MLDGLQFGRKKTITVDITPTWSSLVGGMMEVLVSSKNEDAKQVMREEFYRMAQGADQNVAQQKQNAEAIAKVNS